MAWRTNLNELMFLISVRVPSVFLAHRTHGHVGVAAERALLEVAVVHAQEHEHVAQLAEVGLGLGGAAQLGLAHDLDERRARAVEVHHGGRAAPGAVQVLGGVFLHVDAREVHRLLLVSHLEGELPAQVQRVLELGDLVALGEVRIEVILAVEAALAAHVAAQRQPRDGGQLHGALVGHGQRTGKPEAHRTHVRVGLRTVRGGAAAEELAVRLELRVHLEADDRFVAARHQTSLRAVTVVAMGGTHT
jgi:hypothetical protein